MRVLWVVNAMCAPAGVRSESLILLAHKAAMYLARSRGWHVHLVFGLPVDFLPDCPRVSVHCVPALYGTETLLDVGIVPDFQATLALIRDIGPDLLITWDPRVALLLATAQEADIMAKALVGRVPIVLWDAAPHGADIVERHGAGTGPMLAAGFVGSDVVWHFSEATMHNCFNEVRRWFGYAAAGKMLDKSRVVSCAVDLDYMHSVCPPDEPIVKRDEFTIHIGGRWSMSKGYGLVAEAVLQLRAMGKPVNLLATGRQGQSSAFKKALAETNMEFMPSLSQEDMWRVARTCHVGVLSQDSQCMPAMPMEQLALGLPVLVRSTTHLPRTLAQYPLVWTDVRELMALIEHVRDNYDASVAEAQGWWQEHCMEYDISAMGPAVDELPPGPSVGQDLAVVFDSNGVPRIKSASAGSRRVSQSLFMRTAARHLAASRGYVENMDSTAPEFILEEKDDTHL